MEFLFSELLSSVGLRRL